MAATLPTLDEIEALVRRGLVDACARCGGSGYERIGDGSVNAWGACEVCRLTVRVTVGGQTIADLRARVIGRELGASPETCLDVGRAYLTSEPTSASEPPLTIYLSGPRCPHCGLAPTKYESRKQPPVYLSASGDVVNGAIEVWGCTNGHDWTRQGSVSDAPPPAPASRDGQGETPARSLLRTLREVIHADQHVIAAAEKACEEMERLDALSGPDEGTGGGR